MPGSTPRLDRHWPPLPQLVSFQYLTTSRSVSWPPFLMPACSNPCPQQLRVRRFRAWKVVAAFAAAAALLIALMPFLRPGPDQGGHKGFSAFGLLAEACAAEEHLFAGNQIVHLVNEIIVEPVADATLAKMRWLPLGVAEGDRQAQL